ncbi:MAG: hypothetical protein ACPHCN_12120, partial [Mycobacterium sp.]
LFIDLTHKGLASDEPGSGRFQILSGVRTKAHQTALYNEICLRQRRCAMVANPNTVHATDSEGVQRQGSNHMAQLQPWYRNGERAEVGYAIDVRNQAGGTAAAWKPFHDLLPTYGLDWPLKGSPLERWHIEAFPRRRGTWIPGPFPTRPGVHRQLVRGARGGDVEALQRQIGNTPVDGVFGRGLEADVRKAEVALGRTANGRWGLADQEAWEKAQQPAPLPPVTVPPISIPPSGAKTALIASARAHIDALEDDLDALEQIQ